MKLYVCSCKIGIGLSDAAYMEMWGIGSLYVWCVVLQGIGIFISMASRSKVIFNKLLIPWNFISNCMLDLVLHAGPFLLSL